MARTRPIDKCSECLKTKEIHGKGFCMKCFNKLRRKRKKHEWSYDHAECIICKSTKFKHHCKGLCVGCRNQNDDIYKANQILISQDERRKAKKREYRRKPEVLKRNRERIKIFFKENPHKKNLYGKRVDIKKQIEALKTEIKNGKEKLASKK